MKNFDRHLLRMRKLANGLKTKAGRRGLRAGVAAAIEHKGLLRDLAPSSVIDIGANRGQFSLLCMEICPEARIYAFEPGTAAFEVLRTVTSKAAQVCSFAVAISEHVGELKLNVTQEDDSSSLLPIGIRQEELFGTRVARQEAIQAGHLDQHLRAEDLVAPALLKIDVQGGELDVLKGCASLLPNFSWLYVECSFIELYTGQALIDEVISYVRPFGFSLSGVFNQVASPGELAIQADVLFKNTELPSKPS